MGVREDKQRETRARLERAAQDRSLPAFEAARLALVIAILLSAFRAWSLSTSSPGGLRAAVDRTVSWAAEMVQP